MLFFLPVYDINTLKFLNLMNSCVNETANCLQNYLIDYVKVNTVADIEKLKERVIEEEKKT